MDKSKKIFHIVSGKANPDTMNGVNKVVHALATEQHKMGFDVTVVAIANNTKQRHYPEYNYKLYQKNRIPWRVNQEVIRMLINNSNEDSIFHFHSIFIPWILPMMKSLKKNGRNHIFLTPHGGYQEGTITSIKKKLFFKVWDSKTLKLAEAVQLMGYVTEKCRYITDYAQKIVEIPNGFGDSTIPALNKPESNVIGMLCRLDKHHKGLDLLIPAFAKYKEQGGKCLLQIAGGGPDEMTLKKMAADLGMSENILFVGPLYGNDKWNFLNNCTAHIAPSRFEGMPTACLESAYLKCAQLISPQTNLGKYVEKYNAGFVLPELTENAIVSMLHKFDAVLEDKNKVNLMQQGAFDMVCQELNWFNVSNQINKRLYGLKYN